MAETNDNNGLKSFFDKVADAVKDAAALQVLTFSGDVRSYVKPVTDKATGIDLDWEQFFKKAASSTEATLILVAATQVELDGDTILFVAENPIPSLVEAHAEAVVAAQEYRHGLVATVANLVGLVK